MSSKHTPGPWALESVNTSVGSCHKIGPFPSAGVRSEVHACVYADRLRLGLDDESPIAVELLANARLIAAAPELFRIVERLSQLADGLANSNSSAEEMATRLAEDAKKAIAKVEGRA
ncbi:hypothetical protein [Stenotrophomonas indicatrix]|uniref:hypothetical protein n=1 Tax=Stenotrophomonas indicatrix TaxID=2045451 RepID=UPI0028A6AAB6|nr:hypothetical protein [Stenotrophomonas indicatrix]